MLSPSRGQCFCWGYGSGLVGPPRTRPCGDETRVRDGQITKSGSAQHMGNTQNLAL